MFSNGGLFAYKMYILDHAVAPWFLEVTLDLKRSSRELLLPPPTVFALASCSSTCGKDQQNYSSVFPQHQLIHTCQVMFVSINTVAPLHKSHLNFLWFIHFYWVLEVLYLCRFLLLLHHQGSPAMDHIWLLWLQNNKRNKQYEPFNFT